MIIEEVMFFLYFDISRIFKLLLHHCIRYPYINEVKLYITLTNLSIFIEDEIFKKNEPVKYARN